MAFVPIEGGHIYCRLDGSHQLPVLVLSNSLGTDYSLWDAQIPIFSQYFRVLRFDMRGHGTSPAVAGEYTMDMLGKDVIAILDRLKVRTFSYCGISVSGLIGQWLALNAGKRLTKAVLSSTAANIGNPETWKTRIDTVRNSGLAAISQSVTARWFTEPFQRDNPEIVTRFRNMIESTSPAGYMGTCAAIRDADFRKTISGVRVPTLVIANTQDLATPPASGRYLAEQIPNAQYVELNAAHLSNVELPERFSETALNFLVS